MSELDKLEAWLKKHGYLYIRRDGPRYKGFTEEEAVKLPKGFGEVHQVIVFNEYGDRVWDAVCHYGSYGYEQGLLEVMGSEIVDPDAGDSVEGWLTADEIIRRLERRKANG